jgi:hypothetical protein
MSQNQPYGQRQQGTTSGQSAQGRGNIGTTGANFSGANFSSGTSGVSNIGS